MEQLEQVSVIIPVYNAEAFLKECLLSVVDNPHVGEVILIEDRSPDDCLLICQRYVELYDKIKLYQHPNGENRGAGASRNLGIEMATMPYVAFLDADDFYLSERFEEVVRIFKEMPDIDYVFGSSQYKRDYDSGSRNLKEMRINVNEEFNVFDNMLRATSGYFDTNSITVKKNALTRLDHVFNTDLRLHQDSELWLRIAYHFKGFPDQVVRPGAIVNQHENNRIAHKNAASLFKYWEAVYRYFEPKTLSKRHRKIIKFYHNFYRKRIDRRLTKWDAAQLTLFALWNKVS